MTQEVPLDANSKSLAQQKPVNIRPTDVGLVVLGGTMGTLLRELVGLWLGTALPFPAATFTVNILGAFALGLLLETLARRGPDHGARRAIRLTFGTGLLGGFTTYSALAIDNAQLLLAGNIGGFFGYALATLIGGGIASGLGILLGSRVPKKVPETGQQP